MKFKIMKKIFSLLVLALLLSINVNCIAQNFTITSPTDNYHDMVPPLKSLTSYQLQIKVTNNDSTNTYTVSIDKGNLTASSWVSIDNTSLTSNPLSSITFNLTIVISAGIQDGEYQLIISFNAKDKNGTDHSVQGKNLILIADNTSPDNVTDNLDYSTSTTISILYDGHDVTSSDYTNFDFSSGYKGLKSFKVILNNADNSPKDNKTIDATLLPRECLFSNSLSPNTTYISTVQAVDLAGNSSTSTK